MIEMTPKDFIRTVFIHETGDIIERHPYLAFMIMSTGIEFLGKCISTDEKWGKKDGVRVRFEMAINNIGAFEIYRPYVGAANNYDLYASLRCGLVHAGAPKYSITLSSKGETGHMVILENSIRLNLRCEDFYSDFKAACEDVINREYSVTDKMNKAFLAVPEQI